MNADSGSRCSLLVAARRIPLDGGGVAEGRNVWASGVTSRSTGSPARSAGR